MKIFNFQGVGAGEILGNRVIPDSDGAGALISRLPGIDHPSCSASVQNSVGTWALALPLALLGQLCVVQSALLERRNVFGASGKVEDLL